MARTRAYPRAGSLTDRGPLSNPPYKMRASVRGQGPRSTFPSVIHRLGAGLFVGFFAFGAVSGCSNRLALNPKELEQVRDKVGDVSGLRVYVSKRLVTIYDEADVDQSFEVDKEIRLQSDRQELKNVLTKKISGKIIKTDDSNGMPLLWVTFDASCNEADCAFGFVQNEDGLFRLIQAPPLEGYSDPKNYYRCLTKRRIMKLGKMKSLGEANDIFVRKRKNGKLNTVNLEIIKIIDDRTRTRTRRSGGVD